MKILLLLAVFSFFSLHAATKAKEKVIYKYKQFERFDFEDLSIEGDRTAPGDISVAPRKRTDFKNRLPYRKNFNSEIRKAVNSIK